MYENEYRRLLESLSKQAVTITCNGAALEVRNCFDRVAGEMDPRTAYAAQLTRESFREKKQEIPRELRRNEDKLFGPEQPDSYPDELAMMRYSFGWRSADMSEGVDTRRIPLENKHGAYCVWCYALPSENRERPCLIFIHGGGFTAGDTATVEHQCKRLAQLSGAVVLSVDYPFAPEHPYPAAFDSCYDTVRWAYENAELLGIDRRKIGVSGDSAGGNLSLACALRDRDEGAGRIRYQALIYPLLSRALSEQDAHYYWDEALYENPANNPVIAHQIRVIGMGARSNCQWYVPQDVDRYHPYISPITGDCAGLPKTLLMTAEYDFLRAECDAYLPMLRRSGVSVRAIRYGGIFHGTFDRLGYAPQVEDMLLEIAKDLQVL